MSDNMTTSAGTAETANEQLQQTLHRKVSALTAESSIADIVAVMQDEFAPTLLRIDGNVALLLTKQQTNSDRANKESGAVLAGLVALFSDPRKVHAVYLGGMAIVAAVATLIRVWTPSQNVTLSQQTTQPDARQAVLVQQLSESQAAITNFIAMMRSAANTNAPGGKP